MNRNKLYIFLFAACVLGYIWIAVASDRNLLNEADFGMCLFKRVTNIPCPSCGSTRSVIALINGDFSQALMWNPFGLVLLFFMIITPFWILGDIFLGKSTLFDFYKRSEKFLRQPLIAGMAFLIVLANWIWTIYKGI